MNTFTARITTGVVGVAIVGVAALGAVSVANAATPSATPSASSTTRAGGDSATAATGVPFRAVSAHAIRAQFGRLPAGLKDDLHGLQGKKGSDRVAAVTSIERKALAGSYGAEVQGAAKAAATAWKDAPPTLRKDLAAARHTSRDDRTKAFADVRSKALGGHYGAAVESWAKTVEANVRKEQAAQLPGDVGSIL